MRKYLGRDLSRTEIKRLEPTIPGDALPRIFARIKLDERSKFDFLVPKETQHRLAAKLNASNADFYLEGLGIMAQLHEHGCALCNDTSLMLASELKAKIPFAIRKIY